MDSRHESLQQQTLNHLINVFNNYISQNIDTFLQKDELHNDVKEMAKTIYHCAGKQVEVELILAKENLLSIDRVPLPIIDEMLPNEEDFLKLLGEIKSVSEKQNGDPDLRKSLVDILMDFPSSIASNRP